MRTTKTTTKKSGTKTAQNSKKTSQITEQQIHKRAFEIYIECGAVPGHEKDHWYKAENELMSKIK